MSLFASNDFLTCLAGAFPSGDDVAPRIVSLDGRRYRVLVDRRGRPVTQLPFLDIVEPIEVDPPAEPVGWLFRAERDRIAIDDFDAERDLTSHPFGARYLPYVDWNGVDDFDAYVERCRSRNSHAFREVVKRPNKLERQLGAEITMRYDDDDRDHFEQCLAWKSAQYLATGPPDWIADGGGDLLRCLRARGLLTTSTLHAGDRMIAAHIGYLSDGVFGYWMPSYDATMSKYSPGNILLCELLRVSFERGDRAVDFLEGVEPYKFWYGTHIRRAGLIGRPPLLRRARAELRWRASTFLDERPDLRRRAVAVRDRLRELRH